MKDKTKRKEKKGSAPRQCPFQKETENSESLTCSVTKNHVPITHGSLYVKTALNSLKI